MKNREATTTVDAAVAEQGAPVAPEKSPSKRVVSPKKGAPKGHKNRQGWQSQGSRPEEAAEGDQEVDPRQGTREAARREQGRENRGADWTLQVSHSRRDSEGHRLAGT